MARILGRLHISKPTYLDIGANHPIELNNTYKFYETGCRGVLVEPDPALYEELRRVRPKDIVLNAGIGVDDASSVDFYIMDNRFLSTFSKEGAEHIASYGKNTIEQVVKIPLMNINAVIAEHFKTCPNFVSLDVEGYDFDILKTFDFTAYRPEVFCLETIKYAQDNTEQKIPEIFDFMLSHGYMVYGDTYINTIFVDKVKWMNR